MKLLLSIFLSILISIAYSANSTAAPVLVVHGINSGCNTDVVDAVNKWLGAHADCYPIGEANPSLFSIVNSVHTQGEILCNKLHSDEYYKNGNFSIIGISQGAVITKYIIEYCKFEHPVRNLVTFGGPNMGVSMAPKYPREHWDGYFLTMLINEFVYWELAQWIIAPADYWRNPNDMKGYLKSSRFLAEANNEVHFDQARKDSWLSLNHCMFIKWMNDTVIIPRESSWWGEYKPDFNIVSRFDTRVYKEDLIGIRTLEEQGRAEFVEILGDHMDNILENLNQTVFPVLIR